MVEMQNRLGLGSQHQAHPERVQIVVLACNMETWAQDLSLRPSVEKKPQRRSRRLPSFIFYHVTVSMKEKQIAKTETAPSPTAAVAGGDTLSQSQI